MITSHWWVCSELSVVGDALVQCSGDDDDDGDVFLFCFGFVAAAMSFFEFSTPQIKFYSIFFFFFFFCPTTKEQQPIATEKSFETNGVLPSAISITWPISTQCAHYLSSSHVDLYLCNFLFNLASLWRGKGKKIKGKIREKKKKNKEKKK